MEVNPTQGGVFLMGTSQNGAFVSGAAMTVVSLEGVNEYFKLELVLSDRFTIDLSTYPFVNTEDFDIFSVLTDGALNAENKLIKEQILSDVRDLVEELPEEQKEVLKMRIYNDMSFNEISENTGVSINTALGRMRYAIINLRKIIEKNKIILVN